MITRRRIAAADADDKNGRKSATIVFVCIFALIHNPWILESN